MKYFTYKTADQLCKISLMYVCMASHLKHLKLFDELKYNEARYKINI